MWKDPIVEEMRAVRKQLEKEFGSNDKLLLKRIIEQQKRNKARLVTLSPKPHFSRKAA